MIYLGIDPGASGAIAAIWGDEPPMFCKLKETEHDASNWLRQFPLDDCVTTIELVHAMPKQGVTSTFKFGRSYGFLLGLLTAHRIPYQFVRPLVWQKAMGCLTKGDKRVTKAAAQRLFPDIKITHANADALLLAEYCRRTWV